MIIYSGSKADFMVQVEEDTIAYTIRDNILEKMHRKTPDAEFRSWVNSLEYMYKVLNDDGIPRNSGIAIEYNLPNTAKRVDFLVSGYDAKRSANVVIIELKQWKKLNKVEGLDALVETFTGGRERRVVHPSYQAWSYAEMIRDYNEYAQIAGVNLWPCAYLHNYMRVQDDPLDDPIYKDYLDEAPAFAKGDVRKLREFIKRVVETGDDSEILYEIDNGRIKPSKSLQDAIVGMLESNPEFNLIDDQKVVFERIMELSRQCERDGKKRVLIATGGPGTGKTVIAMNLLARLTQEGVFVQYCSKNSAPRTVYAKKLKGHRTKSSIDNMFKGSGAYVDAPRNAVGVVLADEAHRLNEKSGLYGNQGINQIHEIIHAARLSVFFIDECQRVTVKDIGSVGEIKRWAAVNGAEVYEEELTSQFRCNGSDGYLAWLDDVLEIRETANYDIEGIDYDFEVLDSPDEMRQKVIERNQGSNKSRILAGYCWNWPRAGRADTNTHEITIGDFEISWNLDGGEAFALSPTSINEAGCIHTTQGLEFEYVGVIIGDDLRYEGDHVVTDYTKRAGTDQSIKGLKKMEREDPKHALKLADEIIKNTYRTLMTRGMKGCYVYATDPNLRSYLKERSAACA
ncbi:DNA/RNA helicase domain-containing protein [Collinsella tanakaei]|uniref:DNA/RNA helicase domain-containing protein n=1 Tax=Collinsella tanakaei TaxID=626935 RepID=UPI003AB8E349